MQLCPTCFLYPECVRHDHGSPNVVFVLSSKSITPTSSFEIYALSIVRCLILNLPNLLEMNYGNLVDLIQAIRKYKYFIYDIVFMLYLCHIDIILVVSCHNLSEIICVVVSYSYPSL